MRLKAIATAVNIGLLTMVAGNVSAQTISQIAQSNSLIITGAVGTQNTYRYSTSGDGFSSPMSNSVYANLNINLYGISMPFSFYYTNSSLDFNHPHVAFSLTPSYKSWTGHFGLSSMDFSQYVMNMSFNGIGLEYNDKNWRGGVFYGRLRSAVNDDPTDYYSRSPQYKRMGWGFKMGYTDGSKYFVDLYMLRAYDCVSSLDEPLRIYTRPQESVVVGLKGGYTATNWLSFTANAATSIFSTDTQAGKASVASSFDKVFDTRYSSLSRFAGDMNANFTLPYLNASLSYRIVQPDYTSLGTYYMANNYQSLGLTASSYLFNKVAVSGSFSGQSDNLSDEQLYTTHGYVYNLCASTRLTDNLNLSAMYNGYTQNQKDGTMRVSDSTRVNRRMSSFSLMPSYTFETPMLDHYVALSLNYTENKNLNALATSESDVKTTALGLTYGVDVEPWGMDFAASLSHQKSRGYATTYLSDVCSLTANRSFLSDNSLNVSATMSLCYNKIEGERRAFSVGMECAASYVLDKVHVFSANAGINRYGDATPTLTGMSTMGTDITVSLNYAYTFSLMR